MHRDALCWLQRLQCSRSVREEDTTLHSAWSWLRVQQVEGCVPFQILTALKNLKSLDIDSGQVGTGYADQT